MKQFKLIISAAVFTFLAAQSASAQNVEPFYNSDKAPHIEYVIPAPPSLGDPLFFNDWNQYLWGKSIRETPRGTQAVEDAYICADYFMKRFGEVMGMKLSAETHPKLNLLLLRAHRTEQIAGWSAKTHFARVRPYQQFKEPTGLPSHESPTDFTSYPSGHTHASWLAGMILTSLDPEHTEQIMKVAYELGQSRVILGYHYQSDVDAGRIAGSITFARLCSEKEFMKLLEEARAEMWKK